MNLISIDTASPEFKLAIDRGTAAKLPDQSRLIPVEVLHNGEGRTIALFEARQKPQISWPKAVLQSLRALSLTATAMPCLVILLLGVFSGAPFDLGLALAALLGAVFLQCATNVWNDIADYRKLIDLPGTLGGSGVLQSGALRVVDLRWIAGFFFASAIALGAWVIYSRLESLTPWVLAGTFGALAYSSAPLGLKYRGLGDLLVLAMVGPLLTWGFSAAAFGILIPGSTEIGLAFGFAACALLHANNLQDIDLDQSRGARTLAGQLGFRKSKTLLSLYHGLAIAPIVVGVLQERIPWTFALASAGVALPFFRTSLAVWKAHSPLSPGIAKIRIQAAQDHLLWGVLMLVALLVSRFLA